MAGTDPGGQRPVTHPAPDVKPFDEWNYPYDWPQPDRERGAVRHPEGARSFETAWAVVDSQGKPLGYALVPNLDNIVYELRQLRRALVRSEVAVDLGDLD